MKSINLIFLLILLFSINAFCQPTLLKDINPGPGASSVTSNNDVTRVGSLVYFAAFQTDTGAELWKSDGTTEGTLLVKDIVPGPTGSKLDNFYVLDNDLLLFTADDSIHGLELWRSDGTGAGTFMVKDIYPGIDDAFYSLNSNSDYYAIYKNKLYFGADNGVHGFEFWSSDGTEAGTQMVKDIFEGSFRSLPHSYEEHNGILFFSARSLDGGQELWKTNGTTAGTLLVKNIDPNGESDPRDLRSIGTTLIFTADDGVHDRELWKTDGTSAGTVLVKDIRTHDIGTPSTSSFSTGANTFENPFARVGNMAFFAAIDDSSGLELWKTDGTTAGTQRVKDASNAPGLDGYAPQNFAVLDNEVYYKYDDDISGTELWKSDGTAAGTHIVKDLQPGSFGSLFLPTNIFAHQGKIYFNANISQGTELYESDGTISGTLLFADLNPGSASSNPNHFFSFGKRLLFWANRADVGFEPWIYIAPINVIANSTDAKCYGDSSGTVSFQINPDGIPPFTATWEPNWVSGIEPSNLPAGTYSVTVTDFEGATGTATVTIGQPSALSFSSSTTPESGQSANGTATVNIIGGTPPYEYLWNTLPPQQTQTAINLSTGDYNCTITDMNGCSLIAMTTVQQVTGTNEQVNHSFQLAFHPNPTTMMAYWTKSNEQAVSGSIFGSNGQIIRHLTTEELVQSQLDVRNLSIGWYQVLISFDTGQSALGRLVIVR